MKIRITKDYEDLEAGTEGYTRTFDAQGMCFAYFSKGMQGRGRWIPQEHYEVEE